MTGPGPGKIRLNARVFVVTAEGVREIDAEVYLHIRGWSRAFVTHLDLESRVLNDIVCKPKSGFYARFLYSRGCLTIVALKALKPCLIRVCEDTVFPRVFKDGDCSWCFVGGKYGGVFIGFRREYLHLMEDVARKLWSVKPKRGRRGCINAY